MVGDEAENPRPLTPLLLGLFFVLAATMCAIAGLSLATPGGSMDWIWRWKPDEHAQLLALGPAAAGGFMILALVMAAASHGAFARRRWGWRLAIAIFAVNALADAMRIPSGAPLEGVIGVAVSCLILWWLTRMRVRRAFRA